MTNRFKDKCVTNFGVGWCELPCTRNMFKTSCQAKSHVLTLIECKPCTMHSWQVGYEPSQSNFCSRSAERIWIDDATADEGYKNSVGKQSSKMALFKISLHCFQGALDKHQLFFFLNNVYTHKQKQQRCAINLLRLMSIVT